MNDREAPDTQAPGTMVFRVLYGSHAHGTATPASDEDWRGVFQLPNETFLGLDTPKTTHEDPGDQVYWELGHFCRLLLKGNPNIVGMLFAPDDVISLVHPAFLPLIDERRRFLHTGTLDAYMGWVHREMRDIGNLHRASAKRLSHVPRLLWEIQGALTDRVIEVRPTGQRHSAIMAIKTGLMPYDEAIAYVGNLLMDVEVWEEAEKANLPPPPREWLQRYLLETREAYGRG